MKIIVEPLLKERTTLRLGGHALAELVVEDESDFDLLDRELEKIGGRPFVLGRGSNILAKDKGLALAIIRVENKSGPIAPEAKEGRGLIKMGAGLGLPGVLRWAATNGYSGLEALCGIPGSVAGAVAMNAGSYGTEFGNLLRRVRVYTRSTGLKWVDKKDIRPGYRRMDLGLGDELAVIWAVELELDFGDKADILGRMEENFTRKKKTQPVTAWTAGCVFKNPEGDSAGRLLDQAGFRGKSLGGMRFSPLHANFLENTGTGTADQALELLQEAVEKIKGEFGMELKKEVVVIP